ncbi:MAG: uncharacterized protein JWN69_297 [Alphaproteobacteria bacterium]|nr:uncharacterized protein [Alphaproteobacteria bacterium]
MRRSPFLIALLLAASPLKAETLYISDEQADVVHIVDPSTMEVVGKIPLGRRPRGIALSADGKILYVAVSNDNRIDAVDLKTRTVAAHIPSGPDPETFALHPDGRRLFVANEDDNLASFVDIAARKITGEVAIGTEPEGSAVSPDGSLVVVTSESSSMVHFIDAANGALLDNLLVDTRPRYARFTPDGKRLWVSSEARGTVSVIDVATRKIVGRIDFEAMNLPAEIIQPVGIAITRDGSRAFVALGRGNMVAEIDPKSLALVRTFPVGQRAWNLALSPDEKRLYTANGLSGDMSVIDLVANKTKGNISLGGKPWGIVAAP